MKEMNQKMGTHKFRFSDMMPHSWLYKLKGISRSSSSRKHLPSSPKRLSTSSSVDASSSRNSLRLSSSHYHPPQGSSSSPPKSPFKRKLKRKTVYKPSSRLKLSSSSSSSFNPQVPLTTSRNHRSKPNSANAIILEPSLTSSRNHRSKSFSANTIAVEPSLTSSREHRSKPSSANAVSDSTVGSCSDPVSLSSPSDQDYGFSGDLESHSVDVKNHHTVKKLDDVSEDPSNSSPVLAETVKKPPPLEIRTQKKLKAGSAGIRIRANSPRIARKKTKAGRTSPEPMKKEMAESFAIVLTSVDPERDFRESMVEMIVENKMKEQKDLEDLLACYLSLNSSEYHDTIIKAFEKTWLHLTHLN